MKEIDKQIKSAQKYKCNIQKQKKYLINTLFLYTVILYIVAACIIYSHEFPNSLVECILCYGPLVGFLFVIWFLKMLLTWYFHREAQNNQDFLNKLKERKKQILDHVMKTKTFNEAEEILAEFHPGYIKNLGGVTFSNSISKEKQQQQSKRTVSVSYGIFNTIFSYLFKRHQQQPSNNFALICQKCSGHNGLVGKEQYDNTAFQCCYCSHQNFPGKQILLNKKTAPT